MQKRRTYYLLFYFVIIVLILLAWGVIHLSFSSFEKTQKVVKTDFEGELFYNIEQEPINFRMRYFKIKWPVVSSPYEMPSNSFSWSPNTDYLGYELYDDQVFTYELHHGDLEPYVMIYEMDDYENKLINNKFKDVAIKPEVWPEINYVSLSDSTYGLFSINSYYGGFLGLNVSTNNGHLNINISSDKIIRLYQLDAYSHGNDSSMWLSMENLSIRLDGKWYTFNNSVVLEISNYGHLHMNLEIYGTYPFKVFSSPLILEMGDASCIIQETNGTLTYNRITNKIPENINISQAEKLNLKFNQFYSGNINYDEIPIEFEIASGEVYELEKNKWEPVVSTTIEVPIYDFIPNENIKNLLIIVMSTLLGLGLSIISNGIVEFYKGYVENKFKEPENNLHQPKINKFYKYRKKQHKRLR